MTYLDSVITAAMLSAVFLAGVVCGAVVAALVWDEDREDPGFDEAREREETTR